MNVKITFLGTGTSQGIPPINCNHPVCLSEDPRDKRLRVSLWIEWPQGSYVIDCGPDFRYQMIRAGVQQLDGILFTHEHADHSMGLDDIRSFCFKQGAIPLYAQQRVLDILALRFDYIFNTKNKYPGSPSVLPRAIDREPFNLKGLQFIPIQVGHGKLAILGFRCNNIAYLTDVKTIDLAERKKLQNLDILILSCIRHEPHHSHLNLEEALALIEELQPKKTYLTHISHLLGFHAKVEKKLPPGVFLAYDGLVLEG
jgi:phosphoribosyl 1,2-cyclic phosphate phosphodiesterase